VILETERLVLRPYRISDATAVHAYGSDPDVTRYTDFGPNTWDDTLGFLQTAVHPTPPRIELAITVRGDDRVVGGVGSWPVVEGRWEIGWVLHRNVWGRGYATEAAGAVLGAVAERGDAHTIFARCRPENVASAHVMEKLGMRYVELIPRETEVRGEWVDSQVYETVIAAATASSAGGSRGATPHVAASNAAP
jgi:[ribosomal protein S5]-alanine N-acetyltransferase